MSGVRAVVLAAGLGTRLRPLTEFEPKPLLPVAGMPLVGHTLAQLEAAGCEAAALNLHFMGDRIRGRLGDAWGKMPLVYSEEPEILGTLGALAPLRDFWRECEVLLVINGDSLCRWPVSRLVRRHRRLGAEATLLLSRRARTEEYGGGVGIDGEGRLVSVREGDGRGPVEKRLVFAGAHALSPSLLDGLPVEPRDFIGDLYVPMLERGRAVRTMTTGARWYECGTPALYLRSARAWVGRPWLPRWLRGSWTGPHASVHRAARVRRSVLETEAVVERGARVERSLLLPGARVTAGCVVRECVVGFGVKLAPETFVERRMITSELARSPARPSDSTVGGLVYSPLELPATRSS